jgi:hypothetical protein
VASVSHGSGSLRPGRGHPRGRAGVPSYVVHAAQRVALRRRQDRRGGDAVPRREVLRRSPWRRSSRAARPAERPTK